MLSVDEARDRAADLVARARAAGADAADSVFAASGSTSVQVRLGQLEDVERSEGQEIGLRVFVGKRSASASGSDLSPDALATLADRCVAMARLAPEDPYAGLAPDELLSRGATPALDIDDGGEVSPESLREAALVAEDAGRAIAGVTNSQGASASGGRSVTALATSHGFAAAYAGSSHGVSAQMLAGEGASMQRDYQYSSARYRSDLDDPAQVGTEAGQRAVARLNPERLKSGSMPIMFDRRVSASLIGHLAAAINGASIARGTSFLKDALGSKIFNGSIAIVDDPHRPRGLRSRPHDGEGLPTHVTRLIDGGVLTGWIADCAAARQLGIAPTGHASRGVSGPPGAGLSNVHLEAGSVSVAALIADIAEGFLVTELIGQGVNTLTGDYSRGASGFAIRNGQIEGAVDGVTIAGNLKDMFSGLIPADDLVFEHAINVPTLRIDGMTLAGE
jgi:PmbA protein